MKQFDKKEKHLMYLRGIKMKKIPHCRNKMNVVKVAV
jgi:hypothetical protein